MLLVWLTFLGATAAYKRGAHIGVDAVTARLPAKAQRVAEILATLICLAFFSVLMVYGTRFTAFLQFQTMAAMGVSKSIPFSVIPLSGAIMFLHAVAKHAGDGRPGEEERTA